MSSNLNPVDRMAALAASQVAKREAARKRNREDFPFAAELMDAFSVGFNDGLPPFAPKLIYAEQNGRHIGKPPDDSQNTDVDRLLEMIDANNRTVNAMNKRRK